MKQSLDEINELLKDSGIRYGLIFTDEDLDYTLDIRVIDGNIKAGASVTVLWGKPTFTYDEGYLMALPGLEDVYVVHIPYPTPTTEEEVGVVSPLWVTLSALSNDTRVEKIVLS